jgi:hypothetical protein
MKQFKAEFTINKLKRDKITNDVDLLLQQIPENEYWLVIPSMSDGTVTHCICLTSYWIFDGNFPNILSRNMESLNLCCGKGVTLIGVHLGYKLIHGCRKKRKAIAEFNRDQKKSKKYVDNESL